MMAKRLVVVGSGASGVHFAHLALERGYRVTMIDVGYQMNLNTRPDDSFTELKNNLEDPATYFLGNRYEAVLYPNTKSEYYGFPPHKQYIFAQPNGVQYSTKGFSPLMSFARGGLAETWTGGAYPLNDDELAAFPFGYRDLEPYYHRIANQIGITGADDDLTRFYPLHDNLMPTLDLDEHSRCLLARYEERKTGMNRRFSAFLGRSRIAVLSVEKGGRQPCSYKGRCLWGCPTQSLYTPSITLEACRHFSTFEYLPGMLATHFKYDSGQTIKCIVGVSLNDGTAFEIDGDRFIMAAGTLSSSRIFLESIYRGTGKIVTLTGLMDNRQVLIPFVNTEMIGRQYNPDTYQYHQLAMGIEGRRLDEYVHCQITTLTTALVHPIIQSIPFDFRTATYLFRNLRAGLGIINVNCHDTRRASNHLTLEHDGTNKRPHLRIQYSPPKDERGRLRRVHRTVTGFMRKLNCLTLPGMSHLRPMGASVHYAGTVPMSSASRPLTCSTDCQSHDFKNLYFVDGTTFPFLPAKNLTFTLMANATRVANNAF